MGGMRRNSPAFTMTESGVHQIVDSAFEKYERETAQPRHQENCEKLENLIANLSQVNSTMDKIDGGVTAIKQVLRYLGSAIIGAAALIKIVQMLKGHTP